MQASKLTYVPSQKDFLKFREFKNKHLYALLKSTDSASDSLSTQIDVLADCYAGDPVEFSVVDALFIFLDWRITHVDSKINVSTPAGDKEIDLVDWFDQLGKLTKYNWDKTIEKDGITIELGLPTLGDILELQNQFMLSGAALYQKRIEQLISTETYLLFDSVNGTKFQDIQQKKALFDSLPAEFVKELTGACGTFQQKLDQIEIYLGGVGDKIKFTLETIPILIQNLFGGSPQTLLESFIITSKKLGLSMVDFMEMTPAESRFSLDYILNQQQEEGPSEEDIFAEG